MIATVDPIDDAPAPLTPDERVEQLKQTVSASRLSLYLSCRLKFFFRYVMEYQKPKSAALHVGSAVHSVLKAWNKGRWKDQPLTLTDLHGQFTKAWSDEEGEPVEWEDGEETAEQTTAWRLIETYIRQANPATKPEFVEVPVEAELKGLPKLIGVLDLVQGGVIVDYKTSGQTPNAEKVAHTNEVQLSIYSMLYRHNTGRQEQGLELHHLVKLKTPKIVVTAMPPMTQQREDRLLSFIDGYVTGLDRRDFLPSPGMQCSFCEFFNECKAWH